MEFNYDRPTGEKIKGILIEIQRVLGKRINTRNHNANIWLCNTIAVLSWDNLENLNVTALINRLTRMKDFLKELDGLLPVEDVEYLSYFIEPLEVSIVELKMAYEEQG